MRQTNLELHFLSENKAKNPYKNPHSMPDHFGAGKKGFGRVLSSFLVSATFPSFVDFMENITDFHSNRGCFESDSSQVEK